MRIAMIGLSDKFGGVEKFIINTYKQLKTNEIQFFFVTAAEDLTYLKLLSTDDKILRYTARSKNLYKFKKEIDEIFRIYKFDIVWFNCCSLSNIQELVAAKKYNVQKIIVHSHSSQNMGGKLTRLLHSVNKKRIKYYATDFFACSRVAAEWMFPKKKFEVTSIINNTVDAESFTYNAKKATKIKEKYGVQSKTVIGHVGRFDYIKNHRFLIEVFDEYLKLDSESVLMLCGQGELFNEIKEKVEFYGIQEKVTFLGQVENMSEIYQMIDIFLFPSIFEGLPFCLIEAQAAGIPCLISDTVSHEIEITNLINYENLNEPPAKWALRLKDIRKNKVNTLYEIKNAGFDINTNSERLKQKLFD